MHLWTAKNYDKQRKAVPEQNPISTLSFDWHFANSMASYHKGKAEAFKEIANDL